MRPWLLLVACLACATESGAGAPIPEGRVIYRLQTLEGGTLSMSELRGQPTLVTVMTTWSDPALVEVPLYKGLAQRYGARLHIVCVALDEDPAMARIFRDTFEIPYPVVMPFDRADFSGAQGPFGPIGSIPSSFLLDAQGRIAARMDGMWTPELLARAIAQLVPDP